MQSFLALCISFAATGAARIHLGDTSDNWRDYTWSYKPDKTADWYKKHGQSFPVLAPALEIVEPEKSVVVKIECLGCPFRVRREGEIVETWQEPPQDNSLVCLVFTCPAESNLTINSF